MSRPVKHIWMARL